MSMKFTHTQRGYTSDSGDFRSPATTITYEIHDEDLTVEEVLEQFQYFMKGCSYMMDSGSIEFLEYDDPKPSYAEDTAEDSSPASPDLEYTIRTDFSSSGSSDDVMSPSTEVQTELDFGNQEQPK